MSPEIPNPQQLANKLSRKQRRKARAKAIATPDNQPANAEVKLSPEELASWAREYAVENVSFFESPQATENEAELTPLSNLISAREAYATSQVEARRGKITFDKQKSQRNLDLTEARYNDALSAFIADAVNSRAELDDDHKQALIAELKVRENGNLMGEEVNYYLNLDRNKSKLSRGAEWYMGLSRSKRLAYGLGASAVIGIAVGATGGFIAAGAAVGARIGKGYLNREASRLDQVSLTDEDRDQWVDTALRRQYAHDIKDLSAEEQAAFIAKRKNSLTGIDEKRLFEKARRQKAQYIKLSGATLQESRDYDHDVYDKAIEDSEKEKLAKRKSLKWAMGGAVVGGLVGFAVESASDWHGILRDNTPNVDNEHSGSINPEADSPTTTPETTPDAQTGNDGPSAGERQNMFDEDPSNQPTQPEAPTEPEISARSEYLYGEFAGNSVDITIPNGSNIWDQLELQVDQQYPDISYDEKQRLVGNMKNVLQDKYPNRNLDIVQPGDHFSFELPA